MQAQNTLDRLRPIPSNVHGALDYVTGATLMAVPSLLGLDRRGGLAADLPRAMGAAVIGQSLLTRYELGLLRVLPFRLHLAMDYVLGPLLAASPFLFGYRRRRRRKTWLPHLAAGLFMTLTTLMTRPFSPVDTSRTQLLPRLRRRELLPEEQHMSAATAVAEMREQVGERAGP